MPLGEYLKTGWELFKRYPGGFIGFSLVYFLIQIALAIIPYVGWVASAALSPVLLMGYFIVSAKMLQGRSPQFGDFFLGFRFFFPLLLTALVGGLLTGFGWLLLIIPGAYLMVGYLFAAALVVDRRLDFWPALELSRHHGQPHLVQHVRLLPAAGAGQPVRRHRLGRRPPGQPAGHLLRPNRRLCRPLRLAIRLFRGFPG